MSNIEASVVVGGGPVGLFAAHCLARRGIATRILEARAGVSIPGYACGLHPRTVASFERAQLLPALFAVAHRIERVTLLQCDERGAILDLSGALAPFHWLTLRQGELERVLSEALCSRGIDVVRQAEVTQLVARDGFVRLSVRIGTPEASACRETQYDTKFLIGADGHSSVCRQALGVEFVEQSPPRVFAIHDFRSDLRGWERDAFICRQGGLASAFWPLGPELGRWTFELSRDFHEPPSLESLHALLRERAPWFSPSAEELCWGDVAEFDRCIVRRFGNGRVWLAGDAAHSALPVAFQSMNRGLREAEELAGVIARELRPKRALPGRFARFEHRQQRRWLVA